jgi:hypothetical protein
MAVNKSASWQSLARKPKQKPGGFFIPGSGKDAGLKRILMSKIIG